MDENKIFIQIASYRDLELSKTIRSAIESAKRPDLLRFGILHQYDNKTRHTLGQYKKDSRFQIVEEIWYKTRGVGNARYRCNLLYRGEKWALQIDSHSRFDNNWDQILIDEWYKCNNEKAVLSTYPPEFRYDSEGVEYFTKYNTTQMYIKQVWRSIPKFASRCIESNGKIVRSMFVAGGFQFMPGQVCAEIPYVKEIWFLGEEVIRALQLFTHGYDIYIPNNLPVYHLYNRIDVLQDDAHYLWQDIHEGPLKDIYRHSTEIGYRLAQSMLAGDENQYYLGEERDQKEFINTILTMYDEDRVETRKMKKP